MADTTPVSIGKRENEPPGPDLGAVLGEASADVIRLHVGVIDREDRLESGTGEWLSSFNANDAERSQAVMESVLRSLRTATDATNFTILQALSPAIGTPIEDLERASGLTRLPLAERIGDLVSAGLAAKIPEANQVAGTAAGTAIVRLVTAAGAAGSVDLGKDLR